MPHDPNDDPPVVKLVNLFLLNMLKKKLPMARYRSGSVEYWTDGAWVEEGSPPTKLHVPMLDRLKEMADIPEDAPLRFLTKIHLMLGQGRKVDLDVVYSRNPSGGVAIVTQHALRPERLPSNEDVCKKAQILLSHASDALAREDARARVREAVERVKDQGAYAWFLRQAASTCTDIGLYGDALDYLARARKLDEEDHATLLIVDVQTGIALGEMNRPKDAKAAFDRALAIAETLPRPNIYEVWTLLALARMQLAGGDVTGAEAALARADATTELMLGPKSLARLILAASQVRVMRERDAAAAETFATASLQEAEEEGLVPESEDLRTELGEIALARGDAKAAIEQLREVLQLPSRSPMRARVYTTLARAQRAIGRDADALSSLRSATALVDGALAPDHPIRIEIDRDLATLTATAPYR
jgi:tetratricopeptide (TPR) repeat protein